MKSKNEPRGKVRGSTSRGQSVEGAKTKPQKSSIMVDEVSDVVVAPAEVISTKQTNISYTPDAPGSTTAGVRSKSFSREQMWTGLAFWGLILLGALLRFWGLGDKPLHHDESLHAYFSHQLLLNLENWKSCIDIPGSCYHYDPLLHGPFQFHIMALMYKIAALLQAPNGGVNTTVVRLAAASLGVVIVGLPFFLRDYLGKIGALLACLLLAVSPSMVYFSRFAREDIYMACFTLLLVVALARYVRTRKGLWLVLAAAAFTLSYATKEATFLTVAVFGSFLGALLAWESGVKWRLYPDRKKAEFMRYLPKTLAPITLLGYFVILAPIAKVFLAWMKDLSIYVNDPKNKQVSDAYVQNLKDHTVAFLPWLGIIVGVIALACLIWEMLAQRRRWRGLAAYVDPEQQPLLDTLVRMSWTHWFMALLVGFAIFYLLFTVLFTNIKGGLGDGIWQGLYYWLQQQQVARGEQPWYYYFLLIPLYEQVGLVFGLAGIVRCLRHPSRFRLFLIYWFVGNTFIYSWAGEKMPWLSIHIVMPMLLLAAIGLEPIVVTLIAVVKTWRRRSPQTMIAGSRRAQKRRSPGLVTQSRSGVSGIATAGAVLGGIVALGLLALTLQNMFELSYVHAADGPHEMMIYVQTTPDVTTVMNKIAALDQRLYGGKHQLTIGVTADAAWPFEWYLLDYKNTCFNFPGSCSASSASANPAVIISAGDTLTSTQTQYAQPSSAGKPADYLFHRYRLRAWWDEGYKPPVCVPTRQQSCQGQPQWGGNGPFLWMDYGDTMPANATFDLGLAVKNVWRWWWYREPFGSTMGSTDMGFLVRKDLGMTP